MHTAASLPAARFDYKVTRLILSHYLLFSVKHSQQDFFAVVNVKSILFVCDRGFRAVGEEGQR